MNIMNFVNEDVYGKEANLEADLEADLEANLEANLEVSVSKGGLIDN